MKKKYDLFELPFFILLVIEFLLLAYYNLSTDFVFDCDAAKVMYHSAKMWEAKSFILPNWKYMTTGEWDCTAFLAMFIYGITHNSLTSYALANIINTIIFVLTIYTLLSSVGVRRKNIFLAICILLIPYNWGMLEYTNMMFFSAGQYIYKVLTPLSLLTVFHYKDKYKNKVIYYLLLIWTLLLIFLTVTSSGLYVLVCGLLAIYATRFIYTFILGNKINKDNLIVFILSIFVVLVSYYLHLKWGVWSNANNSTLQSMDNLIANFNNLIISFLNIFGLFKDYNPVFSRVGLTDVVKIPLIFIILVYGFSNIKKTLFLDKLMGFNKDDDYSLIEAELMSMMVINLGIMMITIAATARYQLIGTAPFILLAIITLDKKPINKYFGWILLALMIVVNIFVQSDSYLNLKNVYYDSFNKNVVNEIISEAKENNVNNIVIYDSSEWSEVIRANNPDLDVYTYFSESQMFIDYDVDYPDRYDSFIEEIDSIIVVHRDFNPDNFNDYIKENYEYKKDIDKFCLYVKKA